MKSERRKGGNNRRTEERRTTTTVSSIAFRLTPVHFKSFNVTGPQKSALSFAHRASSGWGATVKLAQLPTHSGILLTQPACPSLPIHVPQASWPFSALLLRPTDRLSTVLWSPLFPPFLPLIRGQHQTVPKKTTATVFILCGHRGTEGGKGRERGESALENRWTLPSPMRCS